MGPAEIKARYPLLEVGDAVGGVFLPKDGQANPIDTTQAFAKGAPSSIALTWELWQRVPRMSLAEVFRLEYWASLGFCAHHDFAEGIRAVLVDKDRNPKWQPATLEEITPAFVDDHLRERGDMAPELVALR